MAEDVYVPRFKARYRDELTPALKDELGFTTELIANLRGAGAIPPMYQERRAA